MHIVKERCENSGLHWKNASKGLNQNENLEPDL